MKYGRPTAPPARHRGQKNVEIDFLRYAERMKNEGYSAEQIEIALAYLWELACTFVEYGYGVHPVQRACGQDQIIAGTPASGALDGVNYPSAKHISTALPKAVKAAMTQPEKEEV